MGARYTWQNMLSDSTWKRVLFSLEPVRGVYYLRTPGPFPNHHRIISPFIGSFGADFQGFYKFVESMMLSEAHFFHAHSVYVSLLSDLWSGPEGIPPPLCQASLSPLLPGLGLLLSVCWVKHKQVEGPPVLVE